MTDERQAGHVFIPGPGLYETPPVCTCGEAVDAAVHDESADERLRRECAEVCTSGCHADDCEHHGHLPAERQEGLRSGVTPERLASIRERHRPTREHEGHEHPVDLCWSCGTLWPCDAAALAAQLPAQEERLREALLAAAHHIDECPCLDWDADKGLAEQVRAALAAQVLTAIDEIEELSS